MVSPVSKGKDLRTVSGRGRGNDSFPQGGLEIQLGVPFLFSFQVLNVQRILSKEETCGTGEHAHIFTAGS